MWLEVAANVAQILSVIGPLILFVWFLARKIDRKLNAIEYQQKPNNGESLRDAVDKTSEKIDKLGDRLGVVERDVAKLSGQWIEHVRTK